MAETTKVLALGQQSIAEVLAKDANEDPRTTWGEAKLSHGVLVSRGVVAGNAWNCIKATATIGCAAEVLAAKLADADEMSTFDEMTDNCRVLRDLGATSVRYVQAKPVFPTTARDFLVVTCKQVVGDAIVIGTKSIELPSMPENPSFVRAHTHISGYILRPITAHSCQVTLIVHMDLGGHMPPAVINLLSSTSPVKLLNHLQHLYGQAV
ncbi:hypothetical protein SPRG_03383 [Saprolegnia parasitica CBS 223.65]|uniref:START domain-containing protein n=1 Tax=Saprolegnia parasitica (strain CBS 223.65) TaxID=695850 RepID=A0A067CZH3_SAPPC|nr:hypothetical protein SPRG_03383 [Saprolegnia parasitica CBS 223.65]KDO32167.1 hypothetical protein SPRG_03383 [Saprolegnia parasitica CBS 223.65]|eukprot:XP_012197350.1 hypothetical protein SPRG_03383 [Saprolegnia parasitica CBS 223.65]